MMDYYLEFLFPEKRVRYIAVAENEDTEKGLSDFVPFKNLFNEWFAKDTSRKVKAAFKAKFATGQRIGAYAPIGYRKHPEIKNKLIIDEETRWIVEKIFDLAIHGRGAASITRILIAEKVPTPGFINFQRDGTFANIYAGAPEEKSYAWTIAQVKSIMKDETYIGHTIHYRETNISFKNKRRVRKPQSEWVRVENTQEPIISEQVFRQVQEQIANRRRKCKDGTTQIFSGLVKCADCGWSLSYGENRQNSKPYGHYHCSKYGQGTRQCSMHYIRYDVLYAYVLSRLQYWSGLVQHDEERLLKQLLNATDKLADAELLSRRALLTHVGEVSTALMNLATVARRQKDFAAAHRFVNAFCAVDVLFGLDRSNGLLLGIMLAQDEGDNEKALDLFERYIDAQLACTLDYRDNPFFAAVQTHAPTHNEVAETRRLTLRAIEEDERYAPIRDEARFRAALGRLRAVTPPEA